MKSAVSTGLHVSGTLSNHPKSAKSAGRLILVYCSLCPSLSPCTQSLLCLPAPPPTACNKSAEIWHGTWLFYDRWCSGQGRQLFLHFGLTPLAEIVKWRQPVRFLFFSFSFFLFCFLFVLSPSPPPTPVLLPFSCFSFCLSLSLFLFLTVSEVVGGLVGEDVF